MAFRTNDPADVFLREKHLQVLLALAAQEELVNSLLSSQGGASGGGGDGGVGGGARAGDGGGGLQAAPLAEECHRLPRRVSE